MKKYTLSILTTILLLIGCSNELPIYEEDKNFDTTIINGTQYALQTLSFNGQTYISEPEQYITPDNYDRLKLGRQIGKTQDGMEIYAVKNDKKRIAMQGFMFPATFYKLSESEK
jgi:PBP1b-binding outer membrane lipoprotein LpoB